MMDYIMLLLKKKKAHNPSNLWFKTAKVYFSPTSNPLWVQVTLQGSSFSAQAQPCRLLLILQNLLISTFPRKDKTGASSVSNQMIWLRNVTYHFYSDSIDQTQPCSPIQQRGNGVLSCYMPGERDPDIGEQQKFLPYYQVTQLGSS